MFIFLNTSFQQRASLLLSISQKWGGPVVEMVEIGLSKAQ